MLRAIVIEDVKAIREKNVGLITTYCPDVDIVATADGVATGVAAIRQHRPDLVFLDVELVDGTGFDLLRALQPVPFKVIFVTAHEMFAIRAFRCSAVDFLLKPMDPAELVLAVAKAKDSIGQEMLEMKLNVLLQNLARPKGPEKLVLRTAEKVYSIDIPDIVRCESVKNYTTFHLAGKQALLVSTTLKEYEVMLTPSGFFRAHQSHLINMAYFDHYIKGEAGTIVLKDKSKVPLAIRKKDAFLDLLDGRL